MTDNENRAERLKSYTALARSMQFPADPPTAREIETMFDLSILHVDKLVPDFHRTMDMISMVSGKHTNTALAAAILVDLCAASFRKLRESLMQTAVDALKESVEDLVPEIKKVMKELGMDDADIVGFMDFIGGKDTDE